MSPSVAELDRASSEQRQLPSVVLPATTYLVSGLPFRPISTEDNRAISEPATAPSVVTRPGSTCFLHRPGHLSSPSPRPSAPPWPVRRLHHSSRGLPDSFRGKRQLGTGPRDGKDGTQVRKSRQAARSLPGSFMVCCKNQAALKYSLRRRDNYFVIW